MKQCFRIISALEGLSFILLLFLAMPIKYIGGQDFLVKLLGMPHGILFLVYLLLALVVAMDEEWSIKTSCLVLLASVIPFATFYVDKKLLRQKHKSL